MGQDGQEPLTLENVLRSVAKPGAVLGDVSGIWAPRGTVHMGPPSAPPPLRAVRGPPWSHTKSKIPIP